MYEWLTKHRAAIGRRAFDGAKVDRLTERWLTTGAAIDDELRGQLDALRARSRDLFKNNEYAAKFGRMVRNNVVGPDGFILQSRILDAGGKPDSAACKAVENAWWRWMRPGNCDIAGRYSFNDLIRLLAFSLARDGEILLREVIGPGYGEFGYQLQVLDVARIDTGLNRTPTAGRNAIIMGIEVDSYRRPVNYYLRSIRQGAAEHETVPASQLMHLYIPQEPEQTRGIPWMHAAMRRLNDLNGYREAAVIAARIGASKMGMYVSPNGQPAEGEDEDEDGNFVTNVEPGQFDVAPPGYDFKTFDPTYPHEQFDAFCKGTLRGIASAIGVAYPSLGNDLTDVNFSSIRSGVLEERDEWMVLQNWMVSALLTPVFERWLAVSLLRGMIVLSNGTPLPAGKKAKFESHVWQPRRWAWVDPKKDVESVVLGINNCIDSPQAAAARQGRDIEDVLDDIANFEQMLSSRGLKRVAASPSPASPAADGPDDE